MCVLYEAFLYRLYKINNSYKKKFLRAHIFYVKIENAAGEGACVLYAPLRGARCGGNTVTPGGGGSAGLTRGYIIDTALRCASRDAAIYQHGGGRQVVRGNISTRGAAAIYQHGARWQYINTGRWQYINTGRRQYINTVRGGNISTRGGWGYKNGYYESLTVAANFTCVISLF
jgi:hypothetical protein